MEMAVTIRSLQERLERSSELLRPERGQIFVEPACLSILALRERRGPALDQSVKALLSLQNRDGSWPAFTGDEPDGCWVTALAAITLLATGRETERLPQSIQWLLGERGRDGNWLSRLPFWPVDNRVKLDPAKYGWSWVPGTASWVIPTAFTLMALRQCRNRGLNRTRDLAERIAIGSEMLLDRMCPGGGWNSGNGVAFGVACSAYIDATSLALLALTHRPQDTGTRQSLVWLVDHVPACPSPYSLAWGILALAAYRHSSPDTRTSLSLATERLTQLIDRTGAAYDTSTLALSALALDAVAGKNVFEVAA